MEEPQQHKKKTLCRFYLRGLCIKTKQDCEFAHGVWQLDYDYYQEGEQIVYDYHKDKDAQQKNIIKGPRIYKDLYEFQQEKVFSLEQINENRPLRAEIRNLMHQRIYLDFIELLSLKHPGIPLTEQFLIREFTRAGFNKILNGTMSLNHIVSYLCEAPGSSYFRTTKALPPDNKKTTVLIRKAQEEEILAAYKKQFDKIMGSTEDPIEENVVKKQLFTAVLPENVPPLNLVMKDKRMGFPQFLTKVLKGDSTSVIFEASSESIYQEATSFLKQQLPLRLLAWNDVYNHLAKVLKTNNGNILNKVKPQLVLEQNWFMFFPSVQFILNMPLNSQIFSNMRWQPCQCPFQKPFPQQELLIDFSNIVPLKQKQSYDINSFESLRLCAPHILNSEILGVDLQGRLRKGGFVEMIQLNNGTNTFLIDIWDLNERGDFETFWAARKMLRNVMVNPKITKIFHDCRHDSIGLHQMIETCICNVFDTSACETLIMQLQVYSKATGKQKDVKTALIECQNAIAQCTNVRTPGLNDILKKYEARHGINQNKDKYHKMWSKGDVSFFCKRPIDPDYREYCIKDVLDLPEVHRKMLNSLPQEAHDIAYWLSAVYAQSAYSPDP